MSRRVQRDWANLVTAYMATNPPCVTCERKPAPIIGRVSGLTRNEVVSISTSHAERFQYLVARCHRCSQVRTQQRRDREVGR